MRRLLLTFVALINAFGISANPLEKEIAEILTQINEKAPEIWGIEFSPNILLIDQQENKMYVITQQGNKSLNTKEVEWNKQVFSANSVTTYDNKRFVTLNYKFFKSLPDKSKVNLLAHESFHYYQDSIWHPPRKT